MTAGTMAGSSTDSSTGSSAPGAVGSLLSSILSEDVFRPAEPHSIEETGLTASLIETLMLKYVALIGSASGRQIADNICLPLPLLEPIYQSLRQRQLFVHTGSAQLGDYVYTLTDQGRQRAKAAMEQCSYIGAAPVPLDEYIVSVDAQSVRAEAPRRAQLQKLSPTSPSSRRFWTRSAPPLTAARGCSCTERRATARPRLPSG